MTPEMNDTPQRPSNRPGLPAIQYRLGTQGEFLQRMLRRLPFHELPDGPNQGTRPLLSLTTRSTSDASIALLDAWACVADVLTFYQERIANEGFLRTAVERRSIMELANSIGYKLKPGVAASTYLVLTIEDAPGAPGKAEVPTGTKVLSIPAQNQKPQTFETVETIEARQEWNTLKPRLTQSQDLAAGARILYLKGTSTGLQPGDAILLVGEERERDPGSERWDFRYVKTIQLDTENDCTVVTWTRGLGEPPVLPAENPRAYAFRLRAALFGHNAAEWENLPDEIKKLFTGTTSGFPPEWPGFSIQSARIDLDASYPRVTAGSWVALVRPNYVEIYRVREVDLTSRTGFGLVSKITRIHPDGVEHLTDFGLRETTVYAESLELEIAEEPLPVELSGDEIELTGWVPGLMEGRTLMVSGKRLRARASNRLTLRSADGLRRVIIERGDSLIVTAPPVDEENGTRWFLVDRDGFSGSVLVKRRFLRLEPPQDDDPVVSEVASLSAALDDQERTLLRLEDPLQNLYDRTTVTIYANVAHATHGETVSEVLGSGDGTQKNQRFTLKKPPLTYVSAATPSGVENSLTVRVNGVAWEEADSLYGLDARDKTYIVHIDDGNGGTGKTHITFGDGRSGARLPTGAENIQATYRSGIGLQGEVEAGSLSLLQTRPLGVRSVTNPLPASGAADPEERDQARQNAPITVLTLERIVSLQDFEDFTRAFSGVGKAQAAAIWDGETHIVHITAATASGETLDPNSVLYINLRQAIDAARDPYLPVVLQGHQPIYFRLSAKVLVDERYVKEAVFEEIEQALLDAFSFEKRAFSQAVSAAEVTTLIQGVAGVIASDLDSLYRDGELAALNAILTAGDARKVGSAFLPAELLLVHPLGVELLDMAL